MKLPPEDEKFFSHIFAENISRLKNFSRQQADLSYQDPGVTLLELFSLLQDMQHFYMDYIDEAHYEKYLRLLGGQVQKMTYSKVALEFYDVARPALIPAGSQFWAGELCLETTADCPVAPNQIAQIITLNQEFVRPVRNESPFYLFASCPKAGNAVLIGFKNPLDAAGSLRLFWETKNPEVYPEEFSPLGEFSCKLLIKGEGKRAKWQRALAQDETKCFLNDGYLTVTGLNRLAAPMVKSRLVLKNTAFKTEGLYWLKITLTESWFEKGPVIRQIKNNTVIAEERRTFRDIPLASSDGTANQTIKFAIDNLDEDSLQLTVGEKSGGKTLWEPWEKTDNLHGCAKDSRVFSYEKGQIRFGNNEHGKIPPQGNGNIRLLSYVTSLGSRGNLKPGTLDSKDPAYKVRNLAVISPGKDREKIQESIDRHKERLGLEAKAVTSRDYERIVKAIPGLDLDKVKCLLSENDPETLLVLVKPNSNRELPELNPGYEKNIARYLEKRRVIGTGVQVRGVKYFGLYFELEVYVRAFAGKAEEVIAGKIYALYPLKAETKANMKGNFGAAVSYSGLYGSISALPWVEGIKTLNIYCPQAGVRGGNQADLNLPESGLAYVEKVSVRVKRG